jgi:hypothetical protein
VADPLTHLCTALLPKAVTGGKHVGPFAIGAVIPDFGSRLPGLALQTLASAGWPIPDWLMHPWAVVHVPVGAALVALIVALWFPERDRAAVLGWLLAGVGLHFAFDVLQFHYEGGYMLFYPLSTWRFELGLIGSEATVPYALRLAALTLVAWILRWTWNRRSVADETPG